MYSVRLITENPREYLPLLLLADESEDMIGRYLDRGSLYVLNENERDICVAVVTMEGEGVCELQNIAVLPEFQRQGYGSLMVETLCFKYAKAFTAMRVGTGGSTVEFYTKNGFVEKERIPGYFPAHYSHPIVDNGEVILDRVILTRPITQGCKCCGESK